MTIDDVRAQIGGEFSSEDSGALVEEAKRRGKIIARYFDWHGIAPENRSRFVWVQSILFGVQFAGDDITKWYDDGLPAAYDAYWGEVVG